MMNFDGRNYSLPGRRLAPGERPAMAARPRTDTTFKVGRVHTVDEDRYVMTVEFFDRQGFAYDVDISQPYAGTSSFIAGMPEVGSIVILGCQENFIWPIGYIPNYTAGLESINTRTWPDSVKTEDRNEFFNRFKRLHQGEIALGSSKGAEVFLSDGLSLSDDMGDSLLLRGKDNSIISASLSNYQFSSGVFLSAGVARRNGLFDPKKEDGFFAVKEVLDNNRITYSLKTTQDPNVDQFFTEYLLEVSDVDNADIPENEVTNGVIPARMPIAVFGLGNLIGNRWGKETYGHILRARLFKEYSDDFGDFSLDALTGEEATRYGMAFSLFKPDRRNPEFGAFFGIDKEGHFYQYMPSATAGGIGDGRSLSLVARGNKKEVWGRDAKYGSSWDTVLNGGIRWVIGSHNERDGNPYAGRSEDKRTTGSVFYMYGSDVDETVYEFDDPDTEVERLTRYRKIEKIGGMSRLEVEGTRETIIEGGENLSAGSNLERISGAKTVSVGTNMNITVGDTYAEKVIKEKEESFGSRRTTITSGDNELIQQSPVGNITEEIKFVGNRETTITTGSIKESILSAGSRSFSTTAGNFEASTKAGNIKLESLAGQIEMATKTGQVDIQALLTLNLKTSLAASVNVQGGTVNLKGKTSNPATDAGVITARSHRDYITGAYLVGSSSVNASI